MPSLLAVLGLDKTQFTAGLNGAKSEARTSGAAIGSALSSAIGAAISVGGIMMAFNSVAQKVADLKKESISTGFDTTALQKFNYALGQMDVDIQSGNVGLGILNKLIGEAAMGEEKAVKIFARWGISTSGKSNSAIFDEIRQSILATTDPAMRVAEAMELFGRGGRELLPYLTASKEALEAMGNHAPIISPKDIEAVDEAKKTIEDLKSRLTVGGAKAIGASGGAGTTLGEAYGSPSLKGESIFSFGGGEGEDTITTAAPTIKELAPGRKKKFDKATAWMHGSSGSQFGKILGAQKQKGILDQGVGGGSIWAAIAGAVIKPQGKKDSPSESHRINKMLDLDSKQKIGAYAAAPPGYMEMVKASVSTQKHIASIDKKIPEHFTAPTRH